GAPRRLGAEALALDGLRVDRAVERVPTFVLGLRGFAGRRLHRDEIAVEVAPRLAFDDAGFDRRVAAHDVRDVDPREVEALDVAVAELHREPLALRSDLRLLQDDERLASLLRLDVLEGARPERAESLPCNEHDHAEEQRERRRESRRRQEDRRVAALPDAGVFRHYIRPYFRRNRCPITSAAVLHTNVNAKSTRPARKSTR